jgi:hypothetical protein
VCGSEQEEQLFVLAGRMSASLSAEGNALQEWRAKKGLQYGLWSRTTPEILLSARSGFAGLEW